MKTKKSKLSYLMNNFFAVLSLTASGAVMAQSMNSLGTLGGTYSYANGVSADGSVIVGFSDTGNNASHAFKYSGTTMTDLSTLGGTNSEAFGVSADGSVIVGDSATTGNSAVHAFKYSGTTMTDLSTL